MLVEIIAIAIVPLAIFVAYCKWAFGYWTRMGVPSLAAHLPFGCMSNPFTKPTQIGVDCKDWYDEFKSKGCKFGGAYMAVSPILVVTELDLVKNVITKDFSHFQDHGFYYNERDDPLSAHLLSVEGQKWRNLRVKLTPTFTSGKMKMMFPTMVECSGQLKEALLMAPKDQPVDIKDVLARFTIDIIGSCAFGIECNSFKDTDNEFIKYGKLAFTASTFENLKGLFTFAFPKAARFLQMTITKPDVSKFFLKLVSDAVKYREKNNVVRKDFLQLLIDIKNSSEGKDSFTMGELAAQVFIFFLGGFETSSTTATFCLFELSQNEKMQEKLRNEINEVLKKHEGKITYEAMQDMRYMEQVIYGKNYV